MNKRKIALASVTSLLAVPTVGLSIGVIASCNKNNIPADDSGIEVSTKDVEVNHNSGVGQFDIILNELPIDNVIYVYITAAEGPHHVELLGDEDRVYHGHPAILYNMYNGIAHIRMGFTEFIGETSKTVVSLEVRYTNRKGEWILKHIYGLNLTVTYVQNPTEEVHIFSLNDLHGVAEGYGEDDKKFAATNPKDPGVIRIMNKISPTIEDHPGSFLVTAGDNNAGDMFSTSVHGESIFKVLKSMGARYSAVGNHAFEWGIAPMATYQFDNWARTDETMGNYFLASNILNGKLDDKKEWETDPNDPDFAADYAFWQSQRVVWADPYKLVNMNGHLVCLIGLTTQATLEDGNKSVVDSLSFIDYNAALDYSIYNLQQSVNPQLYNSIESFVLLTHIESDVDKSGEIIDGKLRDLAINAKLPKLDAIITGHSHKVVNGKVTNLESGKDILISQAECEGRGYADLSFRFDNTKPVGQKKIAVTQDVVDMRVSYDGHEVSYEDAKADIQQQRANPATPVVSNVIKTFDSETGKVMEKLKEVISKRYDTLLYPAAEGNVGHQYYINQRNVDGTSPQEGGYIIDQLGAWITYAALGGFCAEHYEEIEASSAGLLYPSVSLINQDSMKVQLKDKPSESGADVTLKHMYDIQTYENPTYYGFLSIFQLAKIIDHSLSGGKDATGEVIFNYDKPDRNYYVPGEDGTPKNDRNNLSYFPKNSDQTDFISIADEAQFPSSPEYKGLKNCYGVYPCGPVQMYGVRFGVERANTGSNPDSAGRIWRIKYIENTDSRTKTDYPILPDMHILDPYYDDEQTPSKEDLYSTVRDTSKWISSQEFLWKYKGMIPIITNSFLYGGANWETPMEATYMDYNESISWKDYPILKFSQITRDEMIDFCKIGKSLWASKQYFPFDMPIDQIVSKLVEYPS